MVLSHCLLGLTCIQSPQDADDFQIVVTSVSSGSGVLGNTYTHPNFTTSSGANSASVSVSGLPSTVNGCIVIATVYSSNRAAKAKTTERMKVLKIDDSSLGTANGLTQVTGGYGTRIEDSIISLGCPDVFDIKAIYESRMVTILSFLTSSTPT